MVMLLGAGRLVEQLDALTTSVDVLRREVAGGAGSAGSSEPASAWRLSALEATVERIALRQEEILAYLAARLNLIAGSQTAYLGDHVALTFMEDGQRIYVDTRDIGIASHLMSHGVWETHYVNAFRRLLRPGQRVLDLGANHGVYTLVAALAVGPDGEVHAFEANPRLALLASNSARINGYGDRVRMHALAVGETEGVASLSFDVAWSGGGSLREGRADRGGVECRVAALDELFPDPGFTVDLIKMDVEGAEGRALRGMRRLLERSPTVRLLMEFAPVMLADAGVPAAEVTTMLAGMGFRAWTIGLDSGFEPVEWDVLAALTSGDRNILVSRSDPG